jgi:hypothetical protein
MTSLKNDIRRFLFAAQVHRVIDLSRRNLPREKRLCEQRKILRGSDAHLKMAELIRSGRPAAMGKIGDVENKALCWTMGIPRYYAFNRAVPTYGEQELHEQAGVFPKNEETYRRFCDLYIDHLREIDLCALWHNPGEFEVTERICPHAHWTDLRALEPYFNPDAPWSAALRGKSVLVVHPFEDSIRKQHERRSEIWKSIPGLMPDFNLLTLKSPYGFSANTFKDWFAMFEHLQTRMTELARNPGFDVALLGCGAAGLPLAVHAKRLGKVGIHTGGPTQLLFGIRGGRWDQWPHFQKFFNEAWIRPSPHETPAEAKKVDKGGYW